jgi:hypothetical protein
VLHQKFILEENCRLLFPVPNEVSAVVSWNPGQAMARGRFRLLGDVSCIKFQAIESPHRGGLYDKKLTMSVAPSSSGKSTDIFLEVKIVIKFCIQISSEFV